MAIVKGTKENFDAEVLKASGVVVVVDFGANWCGPCKSLVPILDEIVEEDPSKKIVKVDIDEQEELAAQYKIMSVPTLLVFRNGEIIDKSIGLIQKHEVKALFAK
ncbi:thioredoxin [Fusobacterium nucleatum subsp. nucleatum ATCC 23726]|uniref:Thioredoxin n=1 Tax=Fusobacterium nucleatum subsp. nucleatum (strain ATCC 23726 / VPI 4351) TaxID=525283 RepID=D5REA8_FUSN2|nr:thioredoxin [Fusobacterium nucleatum]AVQ22662.1 thioredoxin [Fusobacterium nucleatum subsp. nucleatum ATCC 23726]EFG94848.1 putative thioredoxin [Fusobacterium nucleatum subsp. nucleatum ATCC 23726]